MYNSVEVKEDSSLNGKLIVMNKNNINEKFLLDENLNITIEENYQIDNLIVTMEGQETNIIFEN